MGFNLRFFLFITLFAFSALNVSGQISFDSQEELVEAANDFFEKKEYGKAKPLFSQLLSQDALDPSYNYRFGVCIMYTEADPLKPMPYIEGGASSEGVNSEVFYFLGKLYQLNYQFDNAIATFQKGKKAGFNNPQIDLDRCITECQNGKVLYNDALIFNPAQNKEAIESEFYRPYDFRKLKGKVIPMPSHFKTKYDQQHLSGTFVYTPTNSNVLVYASYGEDGSNAKDLYRVNRLPDGEWAMPQRLPNTINTKFDEDYAFFDKNQQTLYFASKGHNSMGGYDIFRSTYDAKSKVWSPPVNLQFPVNSPYDDFLYLKDPNGKVAFFTSARNTSEGKLRIFKTQLSSKKKGNLAVVEGTFEDKTDSVFNYMAASVLDPITQEIVGKYRSHRLTGKYLLILPPRNDYTLNIGPREAEGFEFDLDIPMIEPYTTLKQGVIYNASGLDGTVTMTNFFNESGKVDTLSFEQGRSIAEVQDHMVAMSYPSDNMDAAPVSEPTQKQAPEDSLERIEALAFEEQIRTDSIAKAESLALERKKLEEEKLKNELAEAARLDSIAQAEMVKEEARKDSVETEEIRIEALAAEEQIRKDSIAKAESLALERKKLEEEKLKNELAEAALSDSIAQAEIAQEESRKDSVETEEIRIEALTLEEQIRTDSVAKAESLALERKKIEEEKLQNELAEAVRLDSIAQTEIVQKDSRKDSVETEEIRKEMILAEKARLDKIAQEVELAKQQAIKEALEAGVLAQKEDAVAQTGIELEDILKEMEQKEQELLTEQEGIAQAAQSEVVQEEPGLAEAVELAEKEETSVSDMELLAAIEAAEREVTEEPAVGEVKDEMELMEIDSSEVDGLTAETTEADLFLQTISKLEAQMEERNSRVEEEKEEDLKQKEEREKASITAKKEAELAVSTAADSLLLESETATDTNHEENSVEDKPLTTEEELVALKSDVNPNEYLEAIDAIENEIAEDVKSRPDKDYSLRDIDEMNGEKSTTDSAEDPTVQAMIDKDRLALEAHRKIAEKKEQELREQMQQDNEVLGLYDPGIVAELKEVETADFKEEILENDSSETLQIAAIVEPSVDANEVAADTLTVSLEEEMAMVEQLLEEEEIVPQTHQKDTVEVNVDATELTSNAEAEILEVSDEIKLAEEEVEIQAKEEPNVADTTLPVISVGENLEEEMAIVEQLLQEVEAIPQTSQNDTLELNLEATEEASNTQTEVIEMSGDVILEEQAETQIKVDSVESETVELAVDTTMSLAEEMAMVEKMILESSMTTEKPEESVEEISEPIMQVEAVEEEGEKSVEETEVVLEETPKSVVEEPNQIAPEAELVQEEQSSEDVKETSVAKEPSESDSKGSELKEEKKYGRVPFMTAALRNYAAEKPSFDKIEDKKARRLVKRMRAEDIGRMAVLKNINNLEILAAGNEQTLSAIKENERNQEVLENTPKKVGREEYVREPFNRNDLKQRKDVCYKLAFGVKTKDVSETIKDAMDPEVLASFFMPEFALQSGHFITLADARSGFYEYRNRGFKDVQIVSYLNGVRIALSDVDKVPFVE